MIPARLSWLGPVILPLVMLLVVFAVLYWHHITGVSFSHLLAGGTGGTGQGC